MSLTMELMVQLSGFVSSFVQFSPQPPTVLQQHLFCHLLYYYFFKTQLSEEHFLCFIFLFPQTQNTKLTTRGIQLWFLSSSLLVMVPSEVTKNKWNILIQLCLMFRFIRKIKWLSMEDLTTTSVLNETWPKLGLRQPCLYTGCVILIPVTEVLLTTFRIP